MRWNRIAVNDRRVELVTEEKSPAGAIKEMKLSSPERPRKSFEDAVAAFRPYVTKLLPFEVDAKLLKVTTINLSESKDGRRGLQVSCNVTVPACSDKAISLTTPLVLEPAEDSGSEAFTLTTEHMSLIALVEQEATKYHDGDRVQLVLGLDQLKPASENAKAFDQKAADAEIATTRKPRAKKRGVAANGKHDTPIPPSDDWSDLPPPGPGIVDAHAIQDAARAGV